MYLYSVVTILCLEEAFNKSEILLVKKLEEKPLKLFITPSFSFASDLIGSTCESWAWDIVICLP